MGDASDPAADDAAQLTTGPYWSLMFEVCESSYRPVNQEPVQLGRSAKTW